MVSTAQGYIQRAVGSSVLYIRWTDWKGEIMTKEIWVQFKDMESYRENGVRLCTLLRETPGECAAFIYIKDIKNVRELNTYSFED